MISTLQKVPTPMKKLLKSEAAKKLLHMFLLYQSPMGQYNLIFLTKLKELKQQSFSDMKEFITAVREFMDIYMDSSSQTVASAAADQIYDIEVKMDGLKSSRSRMSLDEYEENVFEFFKPAKDAVKAWLENISIPFTYTVFYALYSAALSLNNSVCIVIIYYIYIINRCNSYCLFKR